MRFLLLTRGSRVSNPQPVCEYQRDTPQCRSVREFSVSSCHTYISYVRGFGIVVLLYDTPVCLFAVYLCFCVKVIMFRSHSVVVCHTDTEKAKTQLVLLLMIMTMMMVSNIYRDGRTYVVSSGTCYHHPPSTYWRYSSSIKTVPLLSYYSSLHQPLPATTTYCKYARSRITETGNIGIMIHTTCHSSSTHKKSSCVWH